MSKNLYQNIVYKPLELDLMIVFDRERRPLTHPPAGLIRVVHPKDRPMEQEEEREKQWDGGELLVCAIVQLLLVNVAYRIDRQKSAPLLSTSSWAIFCGLGVRDSMHKVIINVEWINAHHLFYANSVARCCLSCLSQ